MFCEIKLQAMRNAANTFKLEYEKMRNHYFLDVEIGNGTPKQRAYKELVDKLNIEAEKVEIDREGDFVETGNKIYDTVANWCKATTDNLLKELVGEDK